VIRSTSARLAADLLRADGRHLGGMTTRILLATSLLVFTACDADALAALTGQGDAKTGFRALLDALGGADQARSATLEPAFREAGGPIELADVAVPCPGGGQMVLSGQLDLGNLDIDPGAIDPGNLQVPSVAFDYSVDFDACVDGGVTIDGSITWSLDSMVDPASYAASFTWSYQGSVEFSGDVSGACKLDLQGTADGDADQWDALEPGAFSGDVCGFDADATLGDGG
jgi:hypothetical protein